MAGQTEDVDSILAAIVNGSDDAIFSKTLDGTITSWNRGAENIYGYSATEAIGQPVSMLVPPDYPDEIPNILSILARNERIVHYETKRLRKDGQEIDVSLTVSPLVNKEGEIVGASVIGRDITERKRAEAERELLMKAIEQAGDIVMITDLDGTIQYTNPAFEFVTGYTREEAQGQTPRILKSGKHGETFYRDLWDAITSGKVWTGHIYNKRKDGKIYIEEATISPVSGPSGEIANYVAVKKDITEYLRLSAQFQHAQKMESVGRLAGGVAHDFNNLLAVIMGYSEMALNRLDRTNPLFADLYEILKAAERSRDIIRQLLAFARRQTISPEIIDLNEIIGSMLNMLRRLIGEDIDLTWMPETDLWPIKMDPSQIDQILANLCVNARDAITGVGKITIETENVVFEEDYCTEQSDFGTGEFILLAVSDDGCGMDKETQSKLFEPFFTTKEMGKGTGLGLATVYGIVKQNNGFIKVYSESGHGTTFKIYLPRSASKTVEDHKPTVKLTTSRGETILLVEDDPALLSLSTRMLQRQGYTVLSAAMPSEAIRLAEAHSDAIHLLMTDVIMPEMNGRDLARKLLSLYPHLKTLFMSGYTANVIAHQGSVLDMGINFMQKPFSMKDLATKVRAALDG